MGNGNVEGNDNRDDCKDQALELYKLEYEQAAARYQNIYQSAWSNFSYLTAVAAGIIAFAGEGFPKYVTVMLATLPLFFWYVAVFVPANVYGDQVIKRLRAIEETLGAKCHVQLEHFTSFDKRNDDSRQWLPVRQIVKISAILLLISLPFLYVLRDKLDGEDKPKTYALASADKPLAVQVVGGDEARKLSQENEQLRGALDAMRRSLDSISADLKDIKARQK